MERLCAATLGRLRPGVWRPAYDLAATRVGIVHLGLGAFHRAHQAEMIDTCLAAGEHDWAIEAVSMRSSDSRDALVPQDGLFTQVLRDGTAAEFRVIGAIRKITVAPEDMAGLIARMSDPAVRIVTLTVTEKAYCVDLGSGRLDATHPDIVHDLTAHQPKSVLGLLAAVLDARRKAGIAPPALVSCDNLPDNGGTLRRVLADFAALKDPALADHILRHVPCPPTMVDRIVPATTDADRAAVSEAIGLLDAWPVVAEPDFRWVIEDHFPGGRPMLERAGAEFVGAVAPYEHMKLRILNGAHTALAAIGRLAGIATIPELMRVEGISAFLRAYWAEALPTLAIAPEIAAAYAERLLVRFANRDLPHKTAQIATDASLKIPQRILAALAERRADGAATDAMVFAVAAYVRASLGLSDDGKAYPVADPVIAAAALPDPRGASPTAIADAFLGLTAVFGERLPKDAGFRTALIAALDETGRDGVLAAMRRHFPAC